MNDIAMQPVMSMYSTDPATGLTIISPRVYRLRQLQACEGTNMSELRLEQRGLAPITYMHHVSKIIEGNTESYRVRICRTCSGLPTLLELGSYTDVESALLVNDVHELMQDRTKQLHLLCVDDVKYFSSIAVRRRGSPHDLLITSVLQERLWKKSSAASATAKRLLKEAANSEVETGTLPIIPPKIEIPMAIQDYFDPPSIPTVTNSSFGLKSSASGVGCVGLETSGGNAISTRNDTLKASNTSNTDNFSRKFNNPTSEVNNLHQPFFLESSDDVHNEIPVYRPTNVNTGAYHNDDFEIPLLPLPVHQFQREISPVVQSEIINEIDSSGSNESRGYTVNDDDDILGISTDSTGYNGMYPNESVEGNHPISGAESRGGQNRPSSQALSRAGRIVEQFKANLVRYHTTFLQWGFFECSANIDLMFVALTDFVSVELTNVISSANMGRNGSKGMSSDSPRGGTDTALREAWKLGRAPRSTLLSTISSVFPGNSMELQLVCKRVSSVIPQDTPSVSRFNDLYALAVEEVQKAEADISALGSKVFPSYTCSSASSNNSPRDSNTMEEEKGSEEGVRVAGVAQDGGVRGGSSVPPVPVPPPVISLSFTDSNEFIRQSYNAASYFDHCLRLCAWDGELSGVQEAEMKLHGVYAQLENKFIAVTQFLLIVTSANSTAIKYASERNSSVNSSVVKDNDYEEGGVEIKVEVVSSERPDGEKEDDIVELVSESSGSADETNPKDDTPVVPSLSPPSHNDATNSAKEKEKAARTDFVSTDMGFKTLALTAAECSSIEGDLGELLKKTTMCVTYCILALTSAASVAWRLCGDSLSASSCIRACNNFLPILVENVFDPSILQEFIQRHLDLMTSIILYSGRRQMLGCGFGVLGPSNDGGSNFVFSRYRPSDLTGNRKAEEPDGMKGLYSSTTNSGQSHTELRLLAFSLGGEIVKQSRRCFASFPRQLTGPAAMVHFEAAFRAYVSIFLASLALEESDLLMKLGYTVKRLLSATNDVLSSLQERITKQNCALVSTHTIISLHGMAEACIFHSKRHVDCASSVFMIVRSCRLILWGCAPRFVLAKMLLEHIAAEEGKRLFADDKEQAAHLVTLKTAADEASLLTVDPTPSESLPYSSSVSTIFSTYDQLDRNGLIRDSSENIDGDYQYERGEQRGERGGKRYRDAGEKAVRSDSTSSAASSSAPGGKKKKKLPVNAGTGTVKAVRAVEPKVRVGLTHSASTSVLTDNMRSSGSGFDYMPQTQQYHTELNGMGGSGNIWHNDYKEQNNTSNMNSSYSMNLNQHHNPLQVSPLSTFGYNPRSLYEQQMMTLSGSNSNMTPMIPGVSHSWNNEMDGQSSIPGLINSSGFTGMTSGYYGQNQNVYHNKNNDTSLNSLNSHNINNNFLRHDEPPMARSESLNSMQGDHHQQQRRQQSQQHQQWMQQQRFLFQQQQHQQR